MARIIVDVNTRSKEDTKKIEDKIFKIVQYHIATIRVIDYSTSFQFHENCPYSNILDDGSATACGGGICSHSLEATVNFMDFQSAREIDERTRRHFKSIEENKWIRGEQ